MFRLLKGGLELPGKPQRIRYLTIDLHRSENLSEGGSIQKGTRYFALAGPQAPVVERCMPLGHRDFLTSLHGLRYPKNTASDPARELSTLGRFAAELLPELPECEPNEALQIDLVMGAAELWAFPFEACLKNGQPAFASDDRRLILTRRMRLGFAAKKRPWPITPRVLFLHAPVAADLPQQLIDDHSQALTTALEPWSKSGKPVPDGLLHVEQVLDTTDIGKCIQRARNGNRPTPFTHVHVLAHGKAILDSITQAVRWGLRLGDENRAASDPGELAEALKPVKGLPVVVTVAACDAANQAATAIPERSFAQELHQNGVPIVLASQLPLTQRGSVTMTSAFYELLLAGEDARWALHATRLALREDAEPDHDWVSLVGYVQLPEGYEDHLLEVGVQRDMERLKAARRRLDDVETDGATDAKRTINHIELELRQRVSTLECRLEIIPKERVALRTECHGILASAHKRLAEVAYRRAKQAEKAGDPREAANCHSTSRARLETALDCYRCAYENDIQSHWLGVQQLALEAVLNGRLLDERAWHTTFFAAELALAKNPEEYWAHGSLAELWLLTTMLGRRQELDAARNALVQLDRLAKKAGDSYAVPSTRHQLQRYVEWWTRDLDFFSDAGDLAADAKTLLATLAPSDRSTHEQKEA